MFDWFLGSTTEDSFRFLQEYENVTNSTPTACDLVTTAESDAKNLRYKIAINILVFLTVSGISSVVDAEDVKKAFRSRPIYFGAAFQFLLMPFIGFLAVSIFPLEPLQAVALLILCASPGGSYSNWWCNLFNADLALSVSMTSLSTITSIGMLPLNIYIYIQLAYLNTHDFSGDAVEVDFKDLGLTLGIVIGAIGTGLLFGSTFPQHQNKTNLMGNIAGTASIILGVFASADTCDGNPPWQQPFYPLWLATAFPLIVALVGVLILGGFLKLEKPQRVAIALETAYQNTSIALAYTIGQGDAGRRAAGIPVIYGGYEAGFFLIFMVTSWKMGWTYAPPKEKLWRVMFENWQPKSANYIALHGEKKDAEDKEPLEDGKKDSDSEDKTEVKAAKAEPSQAPSI